MKVVVLAGGLGTRLSEETEIKPKPMVEVGDHPILWHILKHYSHHGFSEFVIALGYKSETIKRYFTDRLNLSGSLKVDLAAGSIEQRDRENEAWTLHLVETGLETNTGGRLKRLRPLLNDETFMLTYGDGVSDVDLTSLLQFHRATGLAATVSAVRPPARFGGLVLDGGKVSQFTEKPQIGEGWINGGFMVLEPRVFDYLEKGGDELNLERDLLERLAEEGQLAGYRHERFWQCMDTLRDKRMLDAMWREQRAPWRTWR